MCWHTARGLAVGLASLLVLSSCTAGATPSPSPTPAPPSAIEAPTASPTMTPAPSEPPSAAATGRIAYPSEGFAITLADGWHQNDDPGDLFYMSGGVLLAEDGLGSEISVALSRLSAFDVSPAPAADPIGAIVEELMKGMPGGRPSSPILVDPTDPAANPTNLPGTTTRSDVSLPAGPAVRLDGVVEGGPYTTAWIVGGGFVGAGAACEVQGAIHLVLANFADPVAPSVIEQMARSLELLPRETVLEAVGCVPSPAEVTWSFAQHIDADPSDVDMIGWKGGFVAVSIRGGPVVWVSDSGKTWQQVEFPPAPDATFVYAEVAFGGPVVIQSSKSGPAIVWGSRTGQSWSELSRLTAAGTCPDNWTAGSPWFSGVYASGASLVLSGYVCDSGTQIDRIYRSDDGVRWSVVATLPSDALSHGVAPSVGSPGSWDVAHVGSWYVASGLDEHQSFTTTLLWISPDGITWSQLPAPAGARMSPHLAGRDGVVVLATSAADSGTDIWVGEISAVRSP